MGLPTNWNYQVTLQSTTHLILASSNVLTFHTHKQFGKHVPLLEKGVTPFEPEVIFKDTVKQNVPEVYVKWRGRPLSNYTWVPEASMLNMDIQLLILLQAI